MRVLFLKHIMPELITCRRDEIPRDLAWQIRSFVRIQWPHLDAMVKARWAPSATNDASIHFMLVDEDTLVSHASVNSRRIEHRDESYVVLGLSTVFTYPAWRKDGHAQKVVKAASDYMRISQGDLAMLFCAAALRDFYAHCGWEPMDSARILFGHKVKPQLKQDNLVMMMFISEKARAAREIFTRQEVYVGENTW